MSALIALFHNATPEAHALALQSTLVITSAGALIFLGWWLYRAEEAE